MIRRCSTWARLATRPSWGKMPARLAHRAKLPGAQTSEERFMSTPPRGLLCLLAVTVTLVFAHVAPRAERPPARPATLRLTRAEYVDRVQAVWTGQIIAVLLAWPHEHQTASVLWLSEYPREYT